MADDTMARARYGEVFWHAHHEAWKRSDLNQREYCAFQGISLKAFGNWRVNGGAKTNQLAAQKFATCNAMI